LAKSKQTKKKEVQGELPIDKPPIQGKIALEDTIRDYFLQYASYVITDRAIPDAADGFKPVQRRLMHSMKVMDDGRFNKVANIIGHCMQYHPHGDTSIGSALVGMGQKNLLVETQGNWGDPMTGDSAAAPRYIEARLTKFAREVLFAPHITEYKRTYDGRKKEPVTLPARFPILLATGAEGIAVGLSTRILPHNFIEIIDALIAFLKDEPFELYPDFMSGGFADVSDYNGGLTGSRVRVRAKIEKGSGKSVVIKEIPYGTTTAALIDSIIAAGDKGKIKLSHIEDNTAAEVSIVVTFQRGVDTDNAIDALFAFTDCELSHSPNGMVILFGRPRSMSINDIVAHGANETRDLLRRDLEYQLDQHQLKWHYKSLVQIFIENKVYLRIEKCKTWESVLSEIDKGLKPFKKTLRRDVIEEDLIMLTEVKMRRISAFDSEKAKEELIAIDKAIKQVKGHLDNLTQYTIDWFNHLRETYGEGRERKTELMAFDTIKAVTVVERTEKLYIDRNGGFLGTGLKNCEEIGLCSTIDDVIAFIDDGTMQVVKASEKVYVGEKILHAQIFKPEDRNQPFNIVYEDVISGKAWMKRFSVGGVTREKPYNLCPNAKRAKIHFMSVGDGPCLFVKLRKKPRIRTDLYVDMTDQLVKSRGSGGNVLTKNRISSVRKISKDKFDNASDK